MNIKEQSITSNVLWRFAEQVSAQMVSFIVSIILARLLEPESYGTLAVVTIFITILQVFVDNGLGNALIQKKDADDLDFNSVFWMNILLCIGLYLVLYGTAPFLAKLWNSIELTAIIRVLGIIILVSGVKNVLQAYVAKHMIFRKFFFATLFGTICSAVVGIMMAYKGYGVWSLVGQRLTNTIIDTIILFFSIKWKPKLQLSFQRLRTLLAYSWKYTITVLIDVGYVNLRQLLVGRVYSTSDLAFYNQGEQFPQIIVLNINSSLDSVLFPAMSNVQEDVNIVKQMAKRTIKLSSYILCPMMIGLALMAEDIVRIVLTDKWLACVPFLQIHCLLYMLYPLHTTNLNVMKAVGRTDIFLKIEVIKIIIGIVGMLATVWYGIEYFTYGLLFTSVLGALVNMFPTYKLISYSIVEQIKDYGGNLIVSCIMGAIVLAIDREAFNIYVLAMIKVFVGVISFIILSILLKKEELQQMKKLILGLVIGVVNKRK